MTQIKDGHIGVFTRPQKKSKEDQFGGRGRIGYFEINYLNDLGSAFEQYYLRKDPNTLIKGLFIDKELSDLGLGDEE